MLQKIAEKAGCHQCLWLLGEDHEITEVGAMNIFVVMRSEAGGDLELVTPPLDSGCILPGITRQSILELTREWGDFNVVERRITMKEVGSEWTSLNYIKQLKLKDHRTCTWIVDI